MDNTILIYSEIPEKYQIYFLNCCIHIWQSKGVVLIEPLNPAAILANFCVCLRGTSTLTNPLQLGG